MYYYRFFVSFQQRFFNLQKIIAAAVLPVSYTHLDVYKRQVFHIHKHIDDNQKHCKQQRQIQICTKLSFNLYVTFSHKQASIILYKNTIIPGSYTHLMVLQSGNQICNDAVVVEGMLEVNESLHHSLL